jgi:glutamyl-tRNA reductase
MVSLKEDGKMGHDVSVILLGVSHRTASVELRGQLVSLTALLTSRLQGALRTGAMQESVIVSTCNRLEIYAATGDAAGAKAEIEQALSDTLQDCFCPIQDSLYFMQGKDAVRHLMRVTAGLDSLVLGETQILGQVSCAYRDATIAGTAGRLLSRLFASAIHVARKAHTETGINRFPTSTSHIVATVLKNRLRGLDGRKILLIGAGKMVQLAVQILRRHGSVELAFINRTDERARALAAAHGGCLFTWNTLPAALAWADAAVAMTGALDPVVRVRDLSLRVTVPDRRPLLIVDASVPRNVEPGVALLPGVQLVGIDELDATLDENRERRREAVPQVEALIEGEMAAFLSWHDSRNVTPVIADLRRRVEQVADSELEVAMKSMECLTADHRKAIQRVVYRVTNKLLHEPTVRLKSAGAAAPGYGDVVRHLFALGEDGATANRL